MVSSGLVFSAVISGLHELGYDLSSKTHEAKNVYRVTHLLVLYHRGRGRFQRLSRTMIAPSIDIDLSSPDALKMPSHFLILRS